MVLYKYLERRYADAMLSCGNIKIGNLYDYRTAENEQIRDVEEATYRANTHYDDNVVTQNDLTGAAPNLLTIINEGASEEPTVHLRNVTFSEPRILPNRNVYCTTLVASEDVMREFGSDACIRISDGAAFCEALVDGLTRLQLASGISRLRPCIYNGRDEDYYSDNGYWLKAPFYAPQQEARLVVTPFQHSSVIQNQYLNIREIIPFISLHTF